MTPRTARSCVSGRLFGADAMTAFLVAYMNVAFHAKFSNVKRPGLSVNRQPSFSHMPGKSCRHSSGESPEHRQAKEIWAQYIRDQISGCPICVHDGRNASHIECPALTLGSGERMRPWPPQSPGILWFCKQCGEPHLHKLYEGAVAVDRVLSIA